MRTAGPRGALIVGLFLWAAAAAAAEAADYEGRLIQWALGLHDRALETAPEGKTISEVLVASEEIIGPSDPWPQLANVFHVKTKEGVIRQELLLSEGDVYQRSLVAETERTLRSTLVLAVARVVAVQGKQPGTVGLLVVTKDLWSIRFNSSFNFANSFLYFLRLQPSESNFLGLNKRLSLDFFLRPDTFSPGLRYLDPRLLGTRFALDARTAVVVNRQTGGPEGTTGYASVWRPLYSLRTEWGYGAAVSWEVRRVRDYSCAALCQWGYLDEAVWPAPIGEEYDARVVGARAEFVHQVGTAFKTALGGAAGAFTRQFATPLDTGLNEQQRQWFTTYRLPRSEQAAYIEASVVTFEPRYVVLRDLASFALSEDYALGHRLRAVVRYAPPVLGSHYLELGANARYRLLYRDDLLSFTSGLHTRYVLDDVQLAGSFVDTHVAAELSNVSPRIGIGRFVARALVDLRINDLDRTLFRLDGSTGLRGGVRQTGTKKVLFNVEYRTRAVELWTLHLGAVFFYDAGAAFDDAPSFQQTIGIGLRALFPQFDIEPLRIDFGLRLGGSRPPLADRFAASFGQVTDIRPEFLDDAML